MKEIVELSITCISTNIGLEANYRSKISKNVPTPHVSQCFFTILAIWPYICVNPTSSSLVYNFIGMSTLVHPQKCPQV
jgi:hypothetical protein